MNKKNAIKYLLSHFNENWKGFKKDLCIDLSGNFTESLRNNPLFSEISNLINEKPCSLPYITQRSIIWCSLGFGYSNLQQIVKELHSWIIPSYGWVDIGDGFLQPDPKGETFQQAIYNV
ncbi:hypothetical protein K8I28_05625, partial [bacterium]|nr:hypothetical protein [bacterium]